MSDYGADILQWSEHQAALLRRLSRGEAVNAAIDWPNLIEEIESVGRSERNGLRSHIATALEHLIKLQASPAQDPRNGWRHTVRKARRDIERVLKDNPSLRSEVAQMIEDETKSERRDVAASLADYGEQPRVPIASLTFSSDQVVGDWWPDDL